MSGLRNFISARFSSGDRSADANTSDFEHGTATNDGGSSAPALGSRTVSASTALNSRYLDTRERIRASTKRPRPRTNAGDRSIWNWRERASSSARKLSSANSNSSSLSPERARVTVPSVSTGTGGACSAACTAAASSSALGAWMTGLSFLCAHSSSSLSESDAHACP
eukprot:Amastigsp_a2667_5.p3 type:complete len:167 gc:universal Amastigsp_a2667_5:709-209(-)